MDTKHEKKILTIDEAAAILSETLEEVAERKTTVRRATAVARLALAFAKVVEISQLKARVEFLEQILKKRT
ncbi:MAG: hypothetical protein KGI50_00690 [Patescibacteria group bacterium]|nr:hypothetical protein [Patescibacteria group bacterium]MDE2438129.1 hypothetical protein [Patescibacteria group bacterium]